MGISPVNPAPSRLRASQATYLGQICGSQERFCDRYELLRILGRGGFGITFLAKDAYLPGAPLCVIKQLFPNVTNAAAMDRARQRFEQEAKTLSKLGSHANVPTLLNYFERDNEFYLVQEYIRGATLNAEVKQFGKFSEEEIKKFLRAFLPILHYVHANHVIHRDIKPPNLIRCQDDGRLVLIDFGAVKDRMINAAVNPHRSALTQFVGTVGFAPPEQTASLPVYSSDIFALGITCLYLLSGKPPLDFEYNLKTREINWQEHITVSEHLGTVLSKMIRLSARDRYQSAQDVMRAMELEPYLDHLQNCMNLRSRSTVVANNRDTHSSESTSNSVPENTRKALAIRIWNAKLGQNARSVNEFLLPCSSFS
jgi:serine/threonine protein kinase